MTEAREPPALAHIEKTLADSYRKEIDQEENIWRSLPFFAATLALQLAALFQVIERLPSGDSWAAILARTLVVASMACSLGALGVLAASILPAKFRYLPKDTALLEYALGLMEDERHSGNQAQSQPFVALHALKENLARQYALATDNNRQINKRRERRRSIAGLMTILAVVSTIMLVAVTFATYVPGYVAQRGSSDPTRQSAAPSSLVRDGPRKAGPPPPSPADAGGH